MPRMHPMAPSRRRHPLLSTLTLGLAFAATALALAAPQPTATAAAPSPAHGGKKAKKCPASSCGLATTAQLDALVQKMEDSLYSAANGIYDASEPVAAAYQTTLSADGKGCSTERVAATGGAAFPDPSCEARAADTVPSVVVKARCPSGGQYAIQNICGGAVVDAGGKVLSLVPMMAAGASLAETTCGVATAAVPIPPGGRLVVQQAIVCAFDSSAISFTTTGSGNNYVWFDKKALAALVVNATKPTKTAAAHAPLSSSKKSCPNDGCGLVTTAELDELAAGWDRALAAASEAAHRYARPLWASYTATVDGKQHFCKAELVDSRPPLSAQLGFETWCGGGVVGQDEQLSMELTCPQYVYFLVFDARCEGRVLDAEGNIVSLLPMTSKGGTGRTTMCTVDIRNVVVPPGGSLQLRHEAICGGRTYDDALPGDAGGASNSAKEAFAALSAEASGGRIRASAAASASAAAAATITSSSTSTTARHHKNKNRCPSDAAACGLVTRAHLDQAAQDAARALAAVFGALNGYVTPGRAIVVTRPEKASVTGCTATQTTADPPDMYVGPRCEALPDHAIPSLRTLVKCPPNYRAVVAEGCYGFALTPTGSIGSGCGLLAEGAAGKMTLCSVRTDAPAVAENGLEMTSEVACGFNTAALIEAGDDASAPAPAKKALAALAAKAAGAARGGPVDEVVVAWRGKGLLW